jgi:tetratricopeptide (TPR) repeat protein
LTQLGSIEGNRGNFAEGAKYLERAMALDPKADWIRVRAVWIYLDLGDVAAARDVLAGVRPQAPVQLCLFSYSGEEQRGAARLYALPRGDLRATLVNPDENCPSAVIRDDALKRGDYDRALSTLNACLTEDWDPILITVWDSRTICAIRYASILMAKGERDRAGKLLHALLTGMQRHKGYDSGLGARVRGVALALLGDTDGALTALEAAYAHFKSGWRYAIDRAPELQGLRSHPRFQSLAKQVSENAGKQAALLAAMRRAGDVPYRPASQSMSAR